MKPLTRKVYRIGYLWISTLFLMMSIPHNLNAQQLKDYQWSNRILLLIDASQNSEALQAQLKLLQSRDAELLDRDLIIFTVGDAEVLTQLAEPTEIDINDIYKNTGTDRRFRGVVLIGKDGGVKLKRDFEVPPKSIFDLIDGMPMRRAEIKNKG